MRGSMPGSVSPVVLPGSESDFNRNRYVVRIGSGIIVGDGQAQPDDSGAVRCFERHVRAVGIAK